ADLQSAPFAARDIPPLAVEPHGISGKLQAPRLSGRAARGGCYGDGSPGCQPEKPGDKSRFPRQEVHMPAVTIRLDPRPQGVVANVTIDNAAKLNTLGSQLMIEFV